MMDYAGIYPQSAESGKNEIFEMQVTSCNNCNLIQVNAVDASFFRSVCSGKYKIMQVTS